MKIGSKVKHIIQLIKSPHPYFIPVSLMLITIFALFIHYARSEYKLNYDNLNEKLAAETERIERRFSDIVKHTEFVMKVIILQIKKNHKNLEYINNIITKYSVNPSLNNVLSWTSFAWLDNKHIRRIDSLTGSDTRPSNQSNREYTKNIKKHPGKMLIGAPTFGFTSQRYLIPAIISVEDEGEYLGSLSVGFDLVNLSVTLSNIIKDPDIYFALLDTNLDIIMQSPNNLVYATNPINPKALKQFLDDNNITFDNITTFSKIDMLTDGTNYYLYKMPEYPFVIYLHYDNKVVTESFWRDITYRVVEIFAIAMVAVAIIITIYRREKTLRSRVEQSRQVALDASQAKTDFLAYTAHELRSPLGFIISGSEMISNKIFGPINQKYTDYIQSIHQSGQELLEFIDDLLDNMKIEKGSFKIDEAVVDVQKLIIRAIKVNNISYNHKINIETKFAENLPFLVTDTKRLLQIFNNIISNAIKYSPENSLLTVDIGIYRKQMIISFQDQGYGMSTKELKASMRQYGANLKKANAKIKSFGLGLPLVKSLLTSMGARFLINSKVGKGTKIVIIFPKNKIKYNNNAAK
jgi:signal transduction histidine kinase